jgi:hypothetical protein
MCEILVSSASKDELLAALLDTVTQRLHVNDDSPDAERCAFIAAPRSQNVVSTAPCS